MEERPLVRFFILPNSDGIVFVWPSSLPKSFQFFIWFDCNIIIIALEPICCSLGQCPVSATKGTSRLSSHMDIVH